MPLRSKYKFIAAFFLVVFFLNTAAGFACSIGIDLGYNSTHHDHENMIEPKGHDHSAGHAKGSEHPHHHSKKEHKQKDNKQDDCCSNEVTAFNRMAKSISGSILCLHPPVTDNTIPPGFFNEAYNLKKVIIVPSHQVFRRCCSFNDIDVRIAIQSFLI